MHIKTKDELKRNYSELLGDLGAFVCKYNISSSNTIANSFINYIISYDNLTNYSINTLEFNYSKAKEALNPREYPLINPNYADITDRMKLIVLLTIIPDLNIIDKEKDICILLKLLTRDKKLEESVNTAYLLQIVEAKILAGLDTTYRNSSELDKKEIIEPFDKETIKVVHYITGLAKKYPKNVLLCTTISHIKMTYYKLLDLKHSYKMYPNLISIICLKQLKLMRLIDLAYNFLEL